MTIPSWDGPEGQLSTGGSSKNSPMVAALGSGGFAVTWDGFLPLSEDPDGGVSPLIRFYDADRAPLGEGFAATQSLEGSASVTFVASTPTGGVAVLYARYESGATTSFVARFDADGTRLGDDVQILDGGTALGFAALADGSLAVVHNDLLDASRNETYLTVIDAGGTRTVDGLAVAPDTKSVTGAAYALPAGDGLAYLQLTRGIPAGPTPTNDVTLFVMDADGAVTGEAPLIDDTPRLEGLQVAKLADGSFVVMALDNSDDTGGAVPRLFYVSEAGVQTGEATLDELAGYYTLEGLVPDAEGGFVALLRSGTADLDTDPLELVGMKIDPAGGMEGTPFPINRSSAGIQYRGQGVRLADDDMMVVWQDGRGGYATEIFGQAFDPSGTTAGAAPTDIVLTGDPVTPGVAGAAIGVLSAVDADTGDSFVFELSDPGASSVFEIDGDALRYRDGVAPSETAGFDAVAVRVTDSRFNVYEETLEIVFAGGDPAPEGVRKVGDGGRDRLKGKGGDDVLKGKGGPDKLIGRGGDDVLKGGGGKDKLFGGGGADRLDGGGGRDRLKGGGGDDVFVLRKSGFGVIVDFDFGSDVIRAKGASDLSDLALKARGDDVLLKLDGDKLGKVLDAAPDDFDASDFLF